MPIQDVQTNKQHAVPHNIMDVEFKLIGDLTMRQFIYLMVFGGLAYVLSVTMVGIFKWPAVVVLSLFGFALAFLPIQDRGMDEWVVNFIKAIYSPTERIWKKEPVAPSVFYYQSLEVVQQELITLAPTASRRKLEQYLQKQSDTPVYDKLDIPENEYIQKVRDAFSGYSSVAVSVEQDYGPVQDTMVSTEEQPPKLPESPQAPQGPTREQEEKPEVSPPTPLPTVEEKKPLLPQVSIQKPKEIKSAKPGYTPRKDISLSPITPDMHSGRRFFNLSPSSGSLVLPVRGEKVIITSDEARAEEDIQAKAKQLQQLLSKIKSEESLVTPVVSNEVKSEVAVEVKAKETVEKLKLENERLQKEIARLRDELGAPNKLDAERERLEKTLQDLTTKQQKSAEEVRTLQGQLGALQDTLQQKTTETPIAPKTAEVRPLTDKPNVISGVVLDGTNTVMPGVVVLIKNAKGEPIRALKTNPMGEFILSSALLPGNYTVEIGATDDKSLTFDIISLELKNQVVPPILISGKVQ